MSSVILLTLLLIGKSYGACDNIYDDGFPRIKLAAVYCASQLDGAVCTGPGRVYYGDETHGTQWTYTDLDDGESISCQKINFDGCDPVPGYHKSCYIEAGTCHNNNNYIYYEDNTTPATEQGAVYCASQLDGKQCRGPGRVYYGDETNGIRWAYTDLNIGQTIDCQKVNFNGCDPVPNVSKSCYIEYTGSCNNIYQDGIPSLEEDAVLCGDEGDSCSGPGRIYYGSETWPTTWAYKDLNRGETMDCSNTGFGCDPVPGYPKQCYYTGPVLNCDNVYQNEDPIVNEGAILCGEEINGGSCSGPGRIYYGEGLMWTYKDLNRGEIIACSNTAFGCDPVPGYTKQCYFTGSVLDCDNVYHNKHPVIEEGAILCSNEGGSCSGPGRVYFGEGLIWTFKDLNNGETISCSNTDFGCDPVPGYPKQCYII